MYQNHPHTCHHSVQTLPLTNQLGIIYNIGNNLQIGRFSSSGDNFVSDPGDFLFIGRTDFYPKKTKQ